MNRSVEEMSNPRQRFYCSQCSQSFSRKEHLQRHQVKHDAARPFKCGFCSQTFSRSDVMKRHQAVHETAQKQGRPSTGAKSRTAIACDRCASTKVRCTGRIPCEQCTKKGLVCTVERPHTVIRRRNRLPTPSDAEIQSNENDSPVDLNPAIPKSYGSFAPNEDGDPGQPVETFSSNLGVADIGTRMMDFPGYDQEPSIHDQAAAIVPPNSGFMISAPQNFPDLPMIDFSGRYENLYWTDLSLHPQDLNNSLGDFSQLFWMPEENVQPQVLSDQPIVEQPRESPSRPTQHVRRQPRDDTQHRVAIAKNTQNPYANTHLVYLFKPGPYIRTGKISDFLHDRETWTQINMSEGHLNTGKSFHLVVTADMRDTANARIHTMLTKALNEDYGRKLPHLFPPLETIRCLFQAWSRQFATLYPITHPSTFSAANISTQESYSDIGIYLATIMALGCAVVPMQESRLFAVELVYLIRNTMNTGIMHDEVIMSDKWVTSSWIMVTVFGAWAGVKKQLELVEAYMSAYTTFFLRRGFFKPATNQPSEAENDGFPFWSVWIKTERDRRFCQVWYIIDQEVSLFYCVPSTINFTNIRCPMPVSDDLYFAESEEDWRFLIEEKMKQGGPGINSQPLSLANLYYMFLRHDFLNIELEITPLQLRLLLSAIQTQIIQYAQTNRFVPITEQLPSLSTLSTAGNYTQLRQEELQNMLVKWHLLQQRVIEPGCLDETALACTLTYHLISIELFISYEDVQLIAGKEGHTSATPLLPQLQQWAKSSSAWRAISHAGQVLKILQCHPADVVRPPWWPLAVARSALVMWTYTVGLFLASGSPTGIDDSMLTVAPLVSLNDADEDFGTNGKFVRLGEVIPCLQNAKGQLIALHQVSDMLSLYLEILEEGQAASLPICESVQQLLRDIRRVGIPYSKV